MNALHMSTVTFSLLNPMVFNVQYSDFILIIYNQSLSCLKFVIYNFLHKSYDI